MQDDIDSVDYREWQAEINRIVEEINSTKIKDKVKPDNVNHPSHYTAHKSGIECIQITEHMNFCLGNALKYLWRAGLKNDNAIEDLNKARWYIDREIKRLENDK